MTTLKNRIVDSLGVLAYWFGYVLGLVVVAVWFTGAVYLFGWLR